MTRMLRVCLFVLLAGALAVSAFAQSTTVTIRGKVVDEKEAALADAEINAVGTDSGFVKTVKAGPDGSFTLGGLTPGEYNIIVSAQGFEPHTEKVTVLVGQNVTLTFVMTKNAVLNESITVVGQ